MFPSTEKDGHPEKESSKKTQSRTEIVDYVKPSIRKRMTNGVNICAVQQDIQSVLMREFSALMLAPHVSDLIGPSSGAFCTSCIRRLWHVLIRVLLDTYSRYKVVGRRTAFFLQLCNGWTVRVGQYAQYYHIPKSANTACTKRS